MTKITIPASIEEATARLEGLGALLTASSWERAAIVYAFTTLDEWGGDRKSTIKRSTALDRLTPDEFVELGIHGLKSANTVRLYHERWAEYGKAKNVKPGQTVTLPTVEWPPQDRNLGTRVTKASVLKAIAENPEITEAVIEAIAADEVLVRRIVARMVELQGPREVIDQLRPVIDFDEQYQEAGATIVFREADKLAGRWTPNNRTEFVRHFLIRALDNSIEADAVTLAEETERYLKDSVEA